MAGIEPTGRGSPVPLVLKTRGPTRRPFTSGSVLARYCRRVHLSPEEVRMKKLMLLVIVLALGAVVAKKKLAA